MLYRYLVPSESIGEGNEHMQSPRHRSDFKTAVGQENGIVAVFRPPRISTGKTGQQEEARERRCVRQRQQYHQQGTNREWEESAGVVSASGYANNYSIAYGTAKG